MTYICSQFLSTTNIFLSSANDPAFLRSLDIYSPLCIYIYPSTEFSLIFVCCDLYLFSIFVNNKYIPQQCKWPGLSPFPGHIFTASNIGFALCRRRSKYTNYLHNLSNPICIMPLKNKSMTCTICQIQYATLYLRVKGGLNKQHGIDVIKEIHNPPTAIQLIMIYSEPMRVMICKR